MRKCLFWMLSGFCLIGCNKLNDVPKCDDEDVKKGATNFLTNLYANQIPDLKYEVSNIRTSFEDETSKSCGCKGDFELLNYDEIREKYPDYVIFRNNKNINYGAQISAEGFLNVSMQVNHK